jgi:4-hydroxy-tetrahydrodipicolinate reductase
MTRIAINGAAGRMGRRVAALAIESEQFDVAAALEPAGHEAIGRDVGELAGVGTFGLAVAEAWPEPPQVVVDFSTPEGTLAVLTACRDGGVPLVTGTTGLTESQQAEVADAASGIPIVQAANFSVGLNVLLGLVAQAAKALGDGYDVEIAEAHHRFKKDAPSGTAIALARAICEATGRDYGESAVLGRGGRQPQKAGEIGIHALRIGDTVGEHAVHFGALGETVTLSHSAHTRETFARGGLRAASWIVGRPPGLYDMRDVLDLRAGG